MKRILLKISGDALSGDKDFGIDPRCVKKVVQTIVALKQEGLELAIVVGGGNIYRGGDLIQSGVDAADSHNMSMLSTVFNGVVLRDFLEKVWQKAVVMNPLGIKFLAPYNKDEGKQIMSRGEILICVWGTGNPYFTTDSGGVLRALELDCDIMIKATKVDGVYDKDPIANADAKKYNTLSYEEVINKNLKILDRTAVVLASDGKLPIHVLKFEDTDGLKSCVSWQNPGTTIS